MTVIAKQTTVIKLKPEQSSDLPSSQKLIINKGESLDVFELSPAEKGHLKASLEFYFWPDHWKSDDSRTDLNTDPDTIVLDVPYLNQRDNKYEPSSTCNVTCVAMILKYFDKEPSINKGLQLEDLLYEKLREAGKQKTLHSHLSELINEFGINNNFTTTARIEDVKNHIKKGFPVIISGNFTRSGHIIVVSGLDSRGLIINDPFGEVLGKSYKYANKSGEQLHYSYELIEWACSQTAGKERIWAHFPSLEGFTPKLLAKKQNSTFLDVSKDPSKGYYFEITPKERVFLDLIAWCEGTDTNLDTVASGYNIIFGYQTFNDFRQHPNRIVRSGGYSSSAAGRYQIMDFTEKDLLKTYPSLPNFSPPFQDQRCLALIHRRGALDDVKRLDLMGFLKACSKEWASLPFSPYGQPVKTFNNVQQAFNKLKHLHKV